MFSITTCTVTINNGKILKYSIESIVKYVSEIFIFDDSTNEFDRNPYLDELDQYENVKIFRTNQFGKDLGEKKQYLVDNATNNIVMRWDDDFILYNIHLLEYIYKELSSSRLDTIVTKNLNVAFTFNYLRNEHPICGEIYLYKKPLIKFGKLYGFCDFPIKGRVNRIDIERPLFLHFWNFKSYENMCFREYMSQYLCDPIYNNYYEYCFVNDFPNKKYNFNSIIEYKKNKICEYKDFKYNYKKNVCENNDPINLNNLDKGFVDYIDSNYKIQNFFSKNSKLFKYETLQTHNLVNIYFNKDRNIGNMVNFYLFEKLCGFIHNHVELDEPHFLINSHITDNKNSIIWGSGLQNNSESVPFINHITKISNPVVRFKNIYCVRGPLTKIILEKQHNIHISHFGHPLLLMPLLYKSETKPIYKAGISLNNYSLQKLTIDNENFKKIESKGNFTNYTKIEGFIDKLIECKFIITNVLDVLVLCHGYNIPVVFVNEHSFDSEFSIIDYFNGMYENNVQCRTYYKGQNLLKYFKNIKNSYIKPDFVKERQTDLIHSCPFIDTGLKPLLLKMV
jgi:hypothetical protein